MRLNRGTIILLIVAIAVIVVVAILNNQQANAPAVTPTPGVERVALFADATADTVSVVEIIDNLVGGTTRLTKDAGGAWGITSSNAADRVADQAAITTQMGTLAVLQGENRFEVAGDQLVNFGLDTPAYVIRVTSGGTRYTVYVGGTNPTGNRYYTVVETAAASGGDATPEATAAVDVTPEVEVTVEAATGASGQTSLFLSPSIALETVTLSGTQSVILVARETINALTGYIAVPPYVPEPTATLAPPPTLNPMSEVEQATATAEFEATQIADILATITAQALEVTPEATADMTPEVTAEATQE
ncbi:MAG: DUF4340 domain-containing protein [Chloroflexota bacterium]|nr:DUF4340 domain-containing protein [Chloroflexota bacterium]